MSEQQQQPQKVEKFLVVYPSGYGIGGCKIFIAFSESHLRGWFKANGRDPWNLEIIKLNDVKETDITQK
jgi:hypothetical protein